MERSKLVMALEDSFVIPLANMHVCEDNKTNIVALCKAAHEYLELGPALVIFAGTEYSPIRCPQCGAKIASHAKDHLCRMHRDANGVCTVCNAPGSKYLKD